MNKLLKQFFLFMLYTIVVYLVLLIIWGELMPTIFKKNLTYSLGAYGHMYTRTREAEKIKNIDILFIGSSHAYRGFDTRIAKAYGYESFNLGSSSQTPVQTELLLKKYLGSLNPKTVVYEVYPYTFTNDGVESSLDMIANGKIDYDVLNMAFSLNNIKTYNSLVYGYYREIFNRNKNFSENKIIDKDTYIPGGFVEREMAFNNPLAEDGIKTTEWIPLKYQEKAFERILKLIKERGIKLVLVQAPVTKSEYKNYNNNDKIDLYFSAKARYYNFNGLLYLSDSTDFYNNDHLNQNGVIIFNNTLFDILVKDK